MIICAIDLGSELVKGAWTFLGYILGRGVIGRQRPPGDALGGGSCKRQAASLTKENYNVIQEYKGERYVEKRSKTNNRRAV